MPPASTVIRTVRTYAIEQLAEYATAVPDSAPRTAGPAPPRASRRAGVGGRRRSRRAAAAEPCHADRGAAGRPAIAPHMAASDAPARPVSATSARAAATRRSPWAAVGPARAWPSRIRCRAKRGRAPRRSRDRVHRPIGDQSPWSSTCAVGRTWLIPAGARRRPACRRRTGGAVSSTPVAGRLGASARGGARRPRRPRRASRMQFGEQRGPAGPVSSAAAMRQPTAHRTARRSAAGRSASSGMAGRPMARHHVEIASATRIASCQCVFLRVEQEADRPADVARDRHGHDVCRS